MVDINKEQSARLNFWERYEALEDKKDRMLLLSKMASNLIGIVFFKGDAKQRSNRVREELVERFDGLIESKNIQKEIEEDMFM